jgi:putative ABC transport system ATP-binding protein
MQLELKSVCPLPMKDLEFSEKSLWRRDITIASGKNHIIYAPSGTGKTSLMAFIFGMRRDFEGEIFLEGRNVKNITLSQWAEIRATQLSLIMQDLRLVPGLSVGENLLLKNQLTNHKKEAQIKEMLDALGMADKWKQKSGTLSLGQRQRVAIVRALLQPFQLLLMDEPFSHIDKENIRKASSLMIQECASNKANMLMVTLDADFGMTFDQSFYL